jgi:hypothetical protein
MLQKWFPELISTNTLVSSIHATIPQSMQQYRNIQVSLTYTVFWCNVKAVKVYFFIMLTWSNLEMYLLGFQLYWFFDSIAVSDRFILKWNGNMDMRDTSFASFSVCRSCQTTCR